MSPVETKKTILIANPCDAERSLLSSALRSHGFDVLEANCAKETIEIARNQTVDVVLLDTLNWETPGLAALTVLKHDNKTRHINVMLFGPSQSKEQVSEALQKGAVTWVDRHGFELDAFIETINTTIRTKAPSMITNMTGQAAPAPTPNLLEKISRTTIRELLSKIGTLPAFECNLVDTLTAACAKDKLAEHARINVTRDPALAIAVLSAANAKLSDDQPPVQDAPRAAELLNPQEFYTLVERVPPFRANLASLWDAGCFWAHSVATARLAAMLSRRLDLGNPSVAEMAGLLHDLGQYIVATYYPTHYGAMFTAAADTRSVHSMWEREITGAHHGEIGAWAMEHYQLSSLLQDTAVHHHAPEPAGQMMSASSRLLIMLVHVADGLANAMLPADPPLSVIDRVSAEFERTLNERAIIPQSLVENARQIVADLLTEMTYLFPQSMTRSYFYRERPLERVAYLAPRTRSLDLFKAAFEMRSREMIVLDRLASSSLPAGTPFVLNLTGIRETAAQIEVLSSVMAIRALHNRRGIAILPADLPARVAQNLLPSTWQYVCLPVHLWKCIRWLSVDAVDEQSRNQCVA